MRRLALPHRAAEPAQPPPAASPRDRSCARRACGGTANLAQLLLVVAVVVMLAGAHNLWMAQLVSRCFRVAGRTAEGTRGGAVGVFTRSIGGAAGKLAKLGGSGAAGAAGGRVLGALEPAPAAAAPAGAVEVTRLPAALRISARDSARRVLALLDPSTREVMQSFADAHTSALEHVSIDEYVRELAAALAADILAVPAGDAAGSVDDEALELGDEDGAADAAEAAGAADDVQEAPALAPGAVGGDDSAASAAPPAPPLSGQAASLGDFYLPYPWADERYHSQQTCYLQSDESELCVYDSVVCTDGINAFVAQDFASDIVQAAPAEARAGLAALLQAAASGKAAAGAQLKQSPLGRLIEAAQLAARGEQSLDVALERVAELLAAGAHAASTPERLVADLLRATSGKQPPRYMPDPNTACWDLRWEEPSAYEYSQCGKSPGTARELRRARREARQGGEAAEAAALAQEAKRLPNADFWPSMFPPAAQAVRSLHSPATDTANPLGKRRWGPQNSGATFKFKELPPAAIFHDAVFAGGAATAAAAAGGKTDSVAAAAAALESLLLRWATQGNEVEAGGPFEHEKVPGLRIARRTRVAGRTVDWAADPLWIVGLDTGKATSHDPLRWFSRVALLYDAQRNNKTGPFGAHPSDGYYHHLLKWQVSAVTSITPGPPTANTAQFRVGAQWGPLPSQSNIVFAGPGGNEVREAAELPPLPRALLELAAQAGAKTFFAPLREAYTMERGKLLCSKRGAVLGTKPKFFTGRADGWMFRQYAYMLSGLAEEGVQSHPKFSPRRILYVDPPPGLHATSPPLWNRAEVIAAIDETGLPFDVVENILALPFKEQVRLASQAGILVGLHSPSMAVALFLPQHSVVLELTGAGVKKHTFRYLVTSLDLHHMPVHSYTLPPCAPNEEDVDSAVTAEARAAAAAAAPLLHDPLYYRKCAARNISAFDSLLEFACATAHAAAPAVVPIDILKRSLYDAIDTVGAYSLQHPDWFRETNETGGAFVPPLGEIQWDAPFRKY